MIDAGFGCDPHGCVTYHATRNKSRPEPQAIMHQESKVALLSVLSYLLYALRAVLNMSRHVGSRPIDSPLIYGPSSSTYLFASNHLCRLHPLCYSSAVFDGNL